MTEKGIMMKRKFATLVGTAGTRLIILLLFAMLGSLATAVAMESTTTNLTIVRGYQSTSSPSSVVLMRIPGLG